MRRRPGRRPAAGHRRWASSAADEEHRFGRRRRGPTTCKTQKCLLLCAGEQPIWPSPRGTRWPRPWPTGGSARRSTCFQHHPGFKSSGTPKPHVAPDDLLDAAPDGGWAKALPASLRERIDVCLSKAVLVSDRYEEAVDADRRARRPQPQGRRVAGRGVPQGLGLPPRSADPRGNPQEAQAAGRRPDRRHADHDGKEHRQPGEDDGASSASSGIHPQNAQAAGRRLRRLLQQGRGLSPQPHREGLRPGRGDGRGRLLAHDPHDDRGLSSRWRKIEVQKESGTRRTQAETLAHGPRRLPGGHRHDRPAGGEAPGRLADPRRWPARC